MAEHIPELSTTIHPYSSATDLIRPVGFSHLYRSAGENYMVSPERLLSSGGVRCRRERL